MNSKNLENNKGTSAVEFAVVLPLLIILDPLCLRQGRLPLSVRV